MRTRNLWMAALLALALPLWGCGEEEAPCMYDCPLEDGESCGGCGERLAECCYKDIPEDQPKVATVMAVCEGDPGCRACCDECAEMTCDELIERSGCPTEVEGE